MSIEKFKIIEQLDDTANREAFLRLPRVEFLLEQLDRRLKGGVGKMVTNPQMELTDRFSMTVPDNRMADVGICKGDYVVIQRRKKYLEGDVLAVRLGERVFIRRYFRSANRIRLECGTPDRQTMILDTDTPGFSILGNVVQVIREL